MKIHVDCINLIYYSEPNNFHNCKIPKVKLNTSIKTNLNRAYYKCTLYKPCINYQKLYSYLHLYITTCENKVYTIGLDVFKHKQNNLPVWEIYVYEIFKNCFY